MNEWIIAAFIVGVLVVASVSVLALNNTGTDTKAPAVQASKCSSCGNKCTAASNCGSSTCAAAKGTGKCGCGK
jgi:uncharacterized protein YxeA